MCACVHVCMCTLFVASPLVLTPIKEKGNTTSNATDSLTLTSATLTATVVPVTTAPSASATPPFTPNTSNAPGSCAQAYCSYDPIVANGTVMLLGRAENATHVRSSSTLHYKCDVGYALSGTQSRTCLPSGNWCSSPPTCGLVKCLDPGHVNYAIIKTTGGDFYVNNTVEYQCLPGYIPTGHTALRCQINGLWSSSRPRCSQIVCGNPGVVINGSATSNGGDYSLGSMVLFTCNSGFVLYGSSRVSCLANGNWSDRLPTCARIRCRHPGVVANSTVHFVELFESSELVYKCSDGFLLVGNSNLTCLTSGLWSSAPPKCEAVSCGDPGQVSNSLRSGIEFTFSKQLSFSCQPGYLLSGESTLRCLSNGSWTSSLPSCNIVSCGSPDSISNGSLTGRVFTYNSSVTYKCDIGFNLIGDSTLSCLSSGVWSSSVPSCNLVSCGNPLHVDNGILMGSVFTYNQHVQYRCQPGYMLSGESDFVCQADSSWSSSWPSCSRISCGNPGAVRNGSVSPIDGNYLFQSVVLFTCNSGFDLYGSSRVSCLANGNWSDRLPTCARIRCRHPGVVANSTVHFVELFESSELVYKCSDGFLLVGNSNLTCLTSGLWSSAPPKCEAVSCGDPGQVSNSLRSGIEFTFSKQVSFSCQPGYLLSGESTVRCLSNGSWTSSLPSCNIVRCGSPDSISNGSLTGRVFTYNSSVTYKCDIGFNLIGDSTLSCLSSGVWSSSIPSCNLVSCGNPLHVDNGILMGSVFTYNQHVQYRCQPGYMLSGESDFVCQADSSWSSSWPSCSRISCGNPGAVGNGSMSAIDGNYLFQSVVSFVCNSGFDLYGSSRVSCLANGNWSDRLPTCARIRCHHPGVVANSTVHFVELFESSELVYKCSDGFLLVGNSNLTCLTSGLWSSAPPRCDAVSCGDPGQVSNSLRSGSEFTFSKRVSFSCQPGYLLSGESTLRCLSNGSWTSSLPSCNIVSCGSPDSISNGSLTGRVFTYNSSVTYKCDIGFNLIGDSTLSCLSSGVWSSSVPSCNLVSCGNPLHVDNGILMGSVFTYNQHVQYRCQPGYMLSGESDFVCQADSSWSSSWPSCSRISCGYPGAVGNGSMSAIDGNYLFQSVVSFVCNSGFDLYGSSRVSCLANGNWSDRLPTCARIRCRHPGVVANSTVHFVELFESSELVYKCSDGFLLVGNSNLTCLTSGLWSSAPPRCDAVSCGDPGQVSNSFRSGSEFTFSKQVSFSCQPGYLLSGESTLRCLSNGSWTSSLPSCNIVSCGSPDSISNGSLTGRVFTYNSSVTYECNIGFNLIGDSTLSCLSSGVWSSSVPSCNLVSCGNPLHVDNGILMGSVFTYNQHVQYRCQPGYMLSGESDFVCQADSSWSSSWPSCSRISCGNPGAVGNGSMSTIDGNYLFQSVVLFTCNSGFDLYGSSRVSCLANGNWSDRLPTCARIRCHHPGVVANSTVHFVELFESSELVYKCSDGFLLVGNSNLTCLTSGLWSSAPPRCDAVSCGDPGQVSNSLRSGSEFTFSKRVSFSCQPGYLLSGESTLRCLSNGSWTSSLPSCNIVSCGSPDSISNGSLTGRVFTYNSSVTYECNIGFNLIGDSTLSCLSSGVWSSSVPSCNLVSCGNPLHVDNGILMGSVFTYNQHVQYRCQPGYMLNGESDFVCQADSSWSSSWPSCSRISCGNPGAVGNGSMSAIDGNYLFQSVVSFVCNSGFDLYGSSRVSCLANGNWSDRLPTCARIRCHHPGVVANSTVHFVELFESSELVYKCSDGFLLVGNSNLTCLTSGLWSSAPPRCDAVSCGDPGQVSNSLRSGSEFTFSKQVSFSCQPGYLLSGESTLRCLSNGSWTSSLPSCNIISCGSPDSISNGSLTGRVFTYNSSVTFKCNIGFNLIGDSILSCLSSGVWSSSVPSCNLVSCGNPLHVDNGILMGSVFTYNQHVQYRCQPGYMLSGESDFVCQADSSWSSSWPNCSRISCGNPGAVGNGSMSAIDGNYLFQSVVLFTCNSGFDLYGSSRVSCQTNGIWSDRLPTCARIRCHHPGVVANSTVHFVELFESSELVYKCSDGFLLVGNSNLTCLTSGLWSSAPPRCDAVSCGDPGQVSNSLRSGSEFTFSKQVSFSCQPGYLLSGESTVRCLSNGSWTSSLPSCNIVSCGSPDSISNGSLTGRVFTYNSSVTYKCDIGFNLIGDSTLSCLSSGVWSSSAPSCNLVSCGNPLHVDNGILMGSVFTYNQHVQYRCQPGYMLNGENDFICLANGSWSPSWPNCSRVSCGNPGFVGNGSVTAVSGDFLFQSTVSFSCNSGFDLFGQSRISCLANHNWSAPAPLCVVAGCSHPGFIANGSAANSTFPTVRSFNFGFSLVYRCEPGFELFGSPRLQCLDSGFWSSPLPSCEIVECTSLSLVANATMTFGHGPRGPTAMYRCETDFDLVGMSNLTCLADNKWNGELPSCVYNPSHCTRDVSLINGLPVVWGATEANRTLQVRCPVQRTLLIRMATRFCSGLDGDVRWLEANTESCNYSTNFTVLLNDVWVRQIEMPDVHASLLSLASDTEEGHVFTSHDMNLAVQVLEFTVNLYERNPTPSVLHELIRLIDIMAHVNKSLFVEVDRLSSVASLITNTLERVADNIPLVPYDTVTKSGRNVALAVFCPGCSHSQTFELTESNASALSIRRLAETEPTNNIRSGFTFPAQAVAYQPGCRNNRLKYSVLRGDRFYALRAANVAQTSSTVFSAGIGRSRAVQIDSPDFRMTFIEQRRSEPGAIFQVGREV